MAGAIKSIPYYFGVRSFLARSGGSKLRFTGALQATQKSLSTTCPCRIKQISQREEGDKIVIEAEVMPSSREKYLAKIPKHKHGVGCQECPLCRLGLQVRHTDVLIISQFMDSKGKQIPRKVTGLCNDQHRRMGYLIVMAEKAGLIEREVERTVMHNGKVLYKPEEWDDPHFRKYYDETVIEEFLYGPRRRH